MKTSVNCQLNQTQYACVSRGKTEMTRGTGQTRQCLQGGEMGLMFQVNNLTWQVES